MKADLGPVGRAREVGWMVAAVLSVCGAAAGQTGGLGAAVVHSPEHECVRPWERVWLNSLASDFHRRFGPIAGPDGPALYPFYPQAGRLHSDILVNNYVDLNPSSAILTFDCGQSSYDGHWGIDSMLRWREDQLTGVPVFAARDGTVMISVDGNPDHNTSCSNAPPSNTVVIDHGGGRSTWYYHLKKGSVAVAVNQQVKCGHQIGMAASSGCSTGPHLHFETQINGQPYEAFAGPCRAGPSGWTHQENPPLTPYLGDFGVTSADLGTQPGYPTRYPTNAQIPLSQSVIYYWAVGGSLPPNSTWKFEFIRPDGTTDHATDNVAFGNTSLYRVYFFWWGWDIPSMHAIAGTWHVRLFFNNQLMINAPVEIVATVTQGLNRPPRPITLAFDPLAPTASDAILCRVHTDLPMADPDWDLVRYFYLWKRNGQIVRNVVSAGLMDAIPRVSHRDIVECTVTPDDGRVNGAPVTIRVDVGCYVNCDASSISPILTANDFQCFLNAFAAGSPAANCDASTHVPVLTGNDFQCFLDRYAAGCS